MADANNILLEVKGLKTHFDTASGIAKAVDGVSFNVYKNETLGIVGESGSGKSVTSLSLIRLVPDPPGKIKEGSVKFKGKELLDLSYEEMRKIRGKEIAMIFQEPMTSLNPVYTIGFQMREMFLQHYDMSKKEARSRSIEMLNIVGLPHPERSMGEYPHRFSGGSWFFLL